MGVFVTNAAVMFYKALKLAQMPKYQRITQACCTKVFMEEKWRKKNVKVSKLKRGGEIFFKKYKNKKDDERNRCLSLINHMQKILFSGGGGI